MQMGWIERRPDAGSGEKNSRVVGINLRAWHALVICSNYQRAKREDEEGKETEESCSYNKVFLAFFFYGLSLQCCSLQNSV